MGWKPTGGAASSPNHGYFVYAAAMLEPLAIEEMQFGTFSYVVGASETKILLASWETDLGATGRFDMREARAPIPLRDITLSSFTGVGDSTAAIIDPALPSYSDARDTYYDRMQAIFETKTRFVGVAGNQGYSTLLPGPYGIILTGLSFHDSAWLALTTPKGPQPTSLLPLHNEIGDAATDDLRISQRLFVPASKNIMTGITLGLEGGPDDAEGGVSYIICPASWGAVTDPNTYDFRDDFMGATLDTGSDWTRAQSTAGNVEINTAFAWCKMLGNGTWGQNGMFSQASISRAAGKVFECDVFITTTSAANLIVGFHDGAGQSFSDFAHGVYFSNDGDSRRLFIFENGTNRGATALDPGYSSNCLYRVRLTLGSSGACTYQIQGGTEYAVVGGSTWTTITPGTTSSATDPVHAGASIETAETHYVGDVKIY